MQPLLTLVLAVILQPSLSADGRTLVYVDGDMLVRRILPSGDETAVPVPGMIGAPVASGDGSRALVQRKDGRLSVDLLTGQARELPAGLEPVSAGAVDVFRTRLGRLQAGGKTLEPGFHSAAADPYRKLVLLASDSELAVYDARRGRVTARRRLPGARILGPGLIARPGWTVEAVELPGLRRTTLWSGPYVPSSVAPADDALYLITESPRLLRKAYRRNAEEVWALPWTHGPTALLGLSNGLLYVSDGRTLWTAPPEPARLASLKEQIDAPVPRPFPVWILPAALAAGALLLARLAWELRGPSYRRKRR